MKIGVIIELSIRHDLCKKVHPQDREDYIDQHNKTSDVDHRWEAQHESHHSILEGFITLKEEEDADYSKGSDYCSLRSYGRICTRVQYNAKYGDEDD